MLPRPELFTLVTHYVKVPVPRLSETMLGPVSGCCWACWALLWKAALEYWIHGYWPRDGLGSSTGTGTSFRSTAIMGRPGPIILDAVSLRLACPCKVLSAHFKRSDKIEIPRQYCRGLNNFQQSNYQ